MSEKSDVLPASAQHSGATNVSGAAAAQRQTLVMGACYALGNFNDNFYKQAALLLAVSAGLADFQGQATLLFALPFILFSAWAGWFADRLPKRTMIIGAKSLELAAMIVGAWGMVMQDWAWMLGMVFCMGLSSTLFSPALNGSIPEAFPAERVPRVNALIKLFTTAAILVGIALAGAALDFDWPGQTWFAAQPFGRWLVAGIALAAAVAGLLSAFFLTRRPGAGSRNPFPWTGPVDAFRHLYATRRDPALFLVLLAEAFFYFLSTLLLLLINNLGRGQLELSYTATSALSVGLLVGICAGSLLASRGSPESWRKLLAPSLVGISALLCCVSLIPDVSRALQLPLLLGIYSLCGLCGGLYLIPLTSFIQVRPAASDKGRVLGISNSLSFTGILLAGQIFLPLAKATPAWGHLILGLGTLATGLAFAVGLRRLRQEGQACPGGSPAPSLPLGRPLMLLLILSLARALLRLRYSTSLKQDGLEAIQERSRSDAAKNQTRPILFLPNHPALIDPVLLYAHLGADFYPRPLADARQIERPVVRSIASLVSPVLMPDLRKDGRAAKEGVQAALQAVIAALRSGENVLFYPAGGLSRTGVEQLGGNSGVSLLLKAVPDVRLVLVRSEGLWGSSFSWAGGKAPDLLQGLLRGCGWLLANLIFFMPRRQVRIALHEIETPHSVNDKEHSRAVNKSLEAFYNAIPVETNQVPKHFLSRLLPARPVREAQNTPETIKMSPASVAPEIREKVFAFLRQESGVEAFTEDSSLSGDLGVDSLALTGVSLWLEENFGQKIERLEALVTVGDCLLAAAGLLELPEESIISVSPHWFADTARQTPLSVPQGDSIPELVLRQARRQPRRLEVADHKSALSYQDMLVKALALASLIRTLPGQRVGLMLPASPAAAITWLAVLLAGKTPVMANWTTGEANFRHCMALSGVSQVLSSRQLLDRLARQGFRAEDCGVDWLSLEDMAASLSLRQKIMALLKSRLSLLPGFGPCAGLHRVPDIAAILFTSGSEALPKAVPLSHANILANCRDIAQVLAIHSGDRMLGMLPPFHSLGLTGNIVLPLVFGLPVVYHPNPTEASRLADIARAYRPTLLVSPPSFLDGLLRQARPGDLKSFRLGFVGAEKCPDHVYAAFAAATAPSGEEGSEGPGGILCEGYGVTECAPVISVNRPESVVPGSIGQPLPSVTVAVVTAEGTPPQRLAAGETGLLLVRGPNVFSAYLGDVEQPFVHFEGHSWYRTGDLASQDAEGRLTFQGRLKRFIKIGGEMISLPQIEKTLLEAFGPQNMPQAESEARPAPDTDDGPVLAVEGLEGGEKMQPCIVLFTTLAVSRDAANAVLRRAGLSGLFSIALVQRLDAIPLLGSGKIDYRQLHVLAAACQS